MEKWLKWAMEIQSLAQAGLAYTQNVYDIERYERAMNLLKDAKFIIAEMSTASTGQGMELQEAVNLGIPILVIAKTGSKISGLVKGCCNVSDIVYYDDIDDIESIVKEFIKEG